MHVTRVNAHCATCTESQVQQDLVAKVDPLLLLFGQLPEQKIRQICQKEMVRYGVLDSYSVNSNVRGLG